MTNPLSSNERCKHFAPPQPTATQGTATVGPFVCPWCEIERLRRQAGEVAVLILQNDRDEVLKWARGVKLTFSDGAPELACEISTPETSGELEQLRRIDQAARAFVNAIPELMTFKGGQRAFEALCDALFDGRPAEETAAVTSMDHGGGPFDQDGNEGPNKPSEKTGGEQ